MPSTDLTYRSRAVRALVLLHEEHLRRFLVVWNQARAVSVVLPKTDDPDYVSLETLLHHVLGAARRYMTWMCEVLELPDPQIRARRSRRPSRIPKATWSTCLRNGARRCRTSAMIGW